MKTPTRDIVIPSVSAIVSNSGWSVSLGSVHEVTGSNARNAKKLVSKSEVRGSDEVCKIYQNCDYIILFYIMSAFVISARNNTAPIVM